MGAPGSRSRSIVVATFSDDHGESCADAGRVSDVRRAAETGSPMRVMVRPHPLPPIFETI